MNILSTLNSLDIPNFLMLICTRHQCENKPNNLVETQENKFQYHRTKGAGNKFQCVPLFKTTNFEHLIFVSLMKKTIFKKIIAILSGMESLGKSLLSKSREGNFQEEEGREFIWCLRISSLLQVLNIEKICCNYYYIKYIIIFK